MMRFWIVVLLTTAFLTVAGCTDIIPKPVREQAEQEKVTIVKMHDTLFCFRCHTITHYEGGSGKFPHAAHRELLKDMVGELHCNQCHDIRGHRMIRTIKKSESPCSNCHG